MRFEETQIKTIERIAKLDKTILSQLCLTKIDGYLQAVEDTIKFQKAI